MPRQARLAAPIGPGRPARFAGGIRHPVFREPRQLAQDRRRLFEPIELGAYPVLSAEPLRAETRWLAETQVVPHGARSFRAPARNTTRPAHEEGD